MIKYDHKAETLDILQEELSMGAIITHKLFRKT
jgi:hypothetical protein